MIRNFLRAIRAFQKFEDVLLPSAAVELRLRQILFDRGNRLSIFVDEQNGRRAATQRFDAERAAAGEKIEHARADHFIAQAGEDRRLHAIHRRSHPLLRNMKMDSAGRTGDDSHGVGDVAGIAGDGEADSTGSVSRDFFLLRAIGLRFSEETVDHAAEIFQIAADHFLDQVRLWAINRAAHLKIDGK